MFALQHLMHLVRGVRTVCLFLFFFHLLYLYTYSFFTIILVCIIYGVSCNTFNVSNNIQRTHFILPRVSSFLFIFVYFNYETYLDSL